MMSAKIMETLSARGIEVELADRLGFSSGQREGGEVLIIPFVRNGEVVRRKYRSFDPMRTKKWDQDKGAQRIAFNEDVLRDSSLSAFPLLITEGELDACVAIQCGFPRTISVPDGAPPPGQRSKEDLEAGAKFAWLDDIRGLLHKDQFPEIIIASDGDTNGAALQQDLSILLGRYRCKYLTYPKTKNHALGRERLKDLNEVLLEYGVKGVVETVSRAQWIRVDGVYKMSDLPPLPDMVIYEPRHRLFAENFKCRLGDFSVWTGTPGFGKSSAVNDVFNGIAYDNDLTVAWASFEQETQRDHRRSLRTWFVGRPEHRQDDRERRAADEWIDGRHVFLKPQETDDATLDWLIEKMELAATRHNAKILVIDPWNELEHDRRRDESETEYIGRAIRSLKRFAKAFQVHVAVVAHPTKSVKDGEGNYKMPTLYDINGSANWYNKADLGIIIHRENEDDTIFKVQKSRYHEIIGVPGEVRMQFSKDERKFIEIERAA